MTDQQKNTQPNNAPKISLNTHQEAKNLPIHTMRQDLADFLKPSGTMQETPSDKKTTLPIPPISSEKEKTEEKPTISPFLSADHSPKIQPAQEVNKTAPDRFKSPAPASSKTLSDNTKEFFAKTPFKAPSSPEPESYKKPGLSNPIVIHENKTPADPKHHWAKIIYISLSFFIIALFSFGGYYFWLTRNNTTEEKNVPPISDSPTDNFSFSITNPNYLNIDISSDTKTKNKINQYAQKISEQKQDTPIEFILTDSSNEPINFLEFSNLLGMTLPTDITDNLAETFSLFIYNDNGNKSLGLAMDLTSEKTLTGYLSQEEVSFAANFLPFTSILAATPPMESWMDKNFKTNTHKNTVIRYINIISPEELSIDYAIHQNQLLIGTTRRTLRSIIDKFESNTTEPPASPTLDLSPVSEEAPQAEQSVDNL